MKIKASIIILSWLLIAGCKVDPQLEGSLVGKWNWIATTGGLFYHVETPATTGVIMSLKFNPDKTAEKILNGVAQPTRYILNSDSIWGNTITFIHIYSLPNGLVKTDTSAIRYYYRFRRDTLDLGASNGSDIPGETYVRVK